MSENDELLKTFVDTVQRIRLAGLNGMTHGGDRDLWDVLGYKKDLTPQDFYDEYTRGGIGQRIIKAFPAATWRDPPKVTDGEGESRFTKAVEELAQKHRLWHYMSRADRMTGIGRFGLLVMGFNDGGALDSEVTRASKLLWMRPVAETHASIKSYVKEPTSPRFGLPEFYRVEFGSEETDDQPTIEYVVHHSRVLHIAEFTGQDDVFGLPRLEAAFNHLRDLEKVVGGSAEMFWLSARAGLQFIADKDSSLDSDAIQDIREKTEEFQHKLRRALAARGGKWEMLTSQTPDPTGNASTILDLIAGATGIPKRILIGSERGELASSQDENNWLGRINERREQFAVPVMIRPLLERLILLGVIPAPSTSDWSVEWDETDGLTDSERTEIAERKISALEKYVNAIGAEQHLTADEFRELVFGLDPLEPSDLSDLDDVDEDEDAQALASGNVTPMLNTKKTVEEETLALLNKALGNG